MKKSLLAVLPLSFVLISSPVFGADGEMDPASQQALEETQKMLRDPKLRQEALKKDANAESMHRQVEDLAGTPENTEKMYGLAAEVMQMITEKSKGDPAKMMELVQQAQKDPSKFLESLTPAQKAEVEKLARDISAQKKPVSGKP